MKLYSKSRKKTITLDNPGPTTVAILERAGYVVVEVEDSDIGHFVAQEGETVFGPAQEGVQAGDFLPAEGTEVALAQVPAEDQQPAGEEQEPFDGFSTAPAPLRQPITQDSITNTSEAAAGAPKRQRGIRN